MRIKSSNCVIFRLSRLVCDANQISLLPTTKNTQFWDFCFFVVAASWNLIQSLDTVSKRWDRATCLWHVSHICSSRRKLLISRLSSAFEVSFWRMKRVFFYKCYSKLVFWTRTFCWCTRPRHYKQVFVVFPFFFAFFPRMKRLHASI